MFAKLVYLSLFLVLLFSGASFSPKAYAYLDPGTGSIILQAVIAAVLGSMVTLKVFWQRIVNFFKGEGKSENKDK